MGARCECPTTCLHGRLGESTNRSVSSSRSIAQDARQEHHNKAANKWCHDQLSSGCVASSTCRMQRRTEQHEDQTASPKSHRAWHRYTKARSMTDKAAAILSTSTRRTFSAMVGHRSRDLDLFGPLFLPTVDPSPPYTQHIRRATCGRLRADHPTRAKKKRQRRRKLGASWTRSSGRLQRLSGSRFSHADRPTPAPLPRDGERAFCFVFRAAHWTAPRLPPSAPMRRITPRPDATGAVHRHDDPTAPNVQKKPSSPT